MQGEKGLKKLMTFFFFTFRKGLKSFCGLQNGNFYREKRLQSCWEKLGKVTLPPLKIFPVMPLGNIYLMLHHTLVKSQEE